MALQVNAPVFNENGDRKAGGFFPGIFSAGFDHKFLCCHCHCILRDPIQGYCGHRFCRSCRDELLRTQDSNLLNCPGCVEENVGPQEMGKISENRMFPDNAVRREMYNMAAACVFPGCTWRGKFRDYEAHEESCPFRQIACAQCAQPVTDGRMAEHRANECPQRLVLCEHCGMELMFARLQPHLEVCEKFPLVCERCGQADILREQMKEHLEKHCPKRLISCPMGCPEQFNMDMFSDHIHKSIESHLVWTVQKMMLLEQKFEGGMAQPAGLMQVKGEMNNIEKKLQAVERQLKNMTVPKSSSTSSESSQDARAEGGTGQEGKPSKVSSEVAAKTSLRLIEPIVAVLHSELDKAIHSLQILEGHFRQQQAQLDELESRFRAQQQSLSLVDASKADLEMRLAAQEKARYDGTILWKVFGFESKKKEAITGQTTSLYSPAFYSGPCGYKMCARIYPNGDGIGKGSHISLFFVIMRGNYDALLPWPFSQKVTLMMIDQNHKEHIVDAFKPDPTSTSFKRPTTEMNIASGCPLFLPLEKLHSRQHGYLRDDTIFVKIIVDTEGLDRFTEMNPGRFASGYP